MIKWNVILFRLLMVMILILLPIRKYNRRSNRNRDRNKNKRKKKNKQRKDKEVIKVRIIREMKNQKKISRNNRMGIVMVKLYKH